MSLQPPWAAQTPEGVILRLHLQPKASRSEVAGTYGEGRAARLKLRVAAPPVDGAANEELIRFLAGKLGVPASRLELIRGASSRSKDLFVRGASVAELAARLLKA